MHFLYTKLVLLLSIFGLRNTPVTEKQVPSVFRAEIASLTATVLQAQKWSNQINNLAFHTLHDFIDLHATELERIQSTVACLEKNNALSLAQTHVHLLYAFKKQCHEQLKNHLASSMNDEQKAIIQNVLAYEQECNNNGYYVLYHSTLPRYFALHLVDTALCKLYQDIIKHEPITQENIFILRQPAEGQPQEDIETQAQKRLTYLREGVVTGTNYNPEHQVYLLSCNFALSGNLSSERSCTLHYWLQKSVITQNLELPFKSICARYPELEETILAHNNQLEDVIHTFNTNAQSGILLQIVFKSPQLFKDCVYHSWRGGHKKDININGTPTDDIIKIMETLRHNPSAIANELDIMQLRTILTKDRLLDIANPDIFNNFEIRAYCAPEAVLETFKHDVQKVMEQIKEEYSYEYATR